MCLSHHDGLNGLDDIVHVGWETAGLQFGEDDLSIDGDLEGTGCRVERIEVHKTIRNQPHP